MPWFALLRQKTGGLAAVCQQTAIAALFLLALAVLAGCSEQFHGLDLERAQVAQLADRNKDPIRIAVVWDAGRMFFEGAMLAQDEINAAGGIAGRPIELVLFDEAPYLRRAHLDRTLYGAHRNAWQLAANRIASDVVRDQSIVAVLGHTPESETTAAAELTYMRHGLLSMGLAATATRVEQEFSFRMLPQLEEMAVQIAEITRVNRIDTAFIINDLSSDAEQLGHFLHKHLVDRGIRVVGSTSIVAAQDEISPISVRRVTSLLAVDLREEAIGVVFVIAGPASSAEIVRKARRLGLNQFFAVMAGLDPRPYISEVGRAGHDTVVIAPYDSDRYLVRRFARNFERHFGFAPDGESALAYDGIHILAEAIACSDTAEPSAVASTLRYNFAEYAGITGPYLFDTQGISMRRHYEFYGLHLDRDNQIETILLRRPE